jgi:hypothetical protein
LYKYILQMSTPERKYIKNFITALLREEYNTANINLQKAINEKLKARINNANNQELFN